MRAGFECLHELFETQPLDPAEQVFGLHLETVECNLVLLHAAIAEHFNLGAGHPFCRKRIPVVATRFLGKQHRQTAMAGLFRIGAHKKRHQIGANRMGDPCLVAINSVDVALAHRARFDRGQIRTGIRLGKDRGGQDFTGSNLGQPFFLLRAVPLPRINRRQSRNACQATRRRYILAKALPKPRTSIPRRVPSRQIPLGS